MEELFEFFQRTPLKKELSSRLPFFYEQATRQFFYKKSSRTIKNIKSEYPHSDIGRISSMLEYKRIIGTMGYEMVESKGPELMRDPGGGDEFPFHEKGDEIICYNYIAKSGEYVF